jgi:hypothetical protein
MIPVRIALIKISGIRLAESQGGLEDACLVPTVLVREIETVSGELVRLDDCDECVV